MDNNNNQSLENASRPVYREFHELHDDEVLSSNSYEDVEIKYRSAGVMTAQPQNVFQSTIGCVSTRDAGNYLQKPTLKRENVKQNNSVTISSSDKKTFHKLKAPEMPDILLAPYFPVHQSLDVIVSLINGILGETSGASYHFDESKCEWTVVYLYGSSHVKFQMFVYHKNSNEYIVEGNRLLGDGFSFRSIFQQVKSQLSSVTDDSHRYNDISNSTQIPYFVDDELSDDTLQSDCFESIFRMAKESTIEAQLEASRMLCDLTADTSGMQQAVVDNGGLTILKGLIESSFSDWAKQHAMFALANLADAKIFETAIMKENLLPLLIKYATDGPYNTAEMRRSAVHIIATLCDSCPSEVVKSLGKSFIINWMNTVDSIHDEKLKLHACRAKTLLSKVAEVTN